METGSAALEHERLIDAPLNPEEVLQALKEHNLQLFNDLRAQNPEWIPALPTPHDFNLRKSNLSSMDLRGMDLSQIDLSSANLKSAQLDDADFSRANFTAADLQGVTLHGTIFLGTIGLFGRARARLSPYEQTIEGGSEYAIFRNSGDHLPWSMLRSIGTLRVFGTSYMLILVLVAYAGLVEWINTTTLDWAEMLPKGGGEYIQHVRQLILNRFPLIEVAPHFGIQLLMVLCLAVGATLYEFFCPDLIKENTESRWTRELNLSLIEYRAADASYPRARTAAFFFYGIGGLYTLSYLSFKIFRATLYFLGFF